MNCISPWLRHSFNLPRSTNYFFPSFHHIFMESDCKSQFMSGCFRVNELVIGGSRVKVQAGAHLPLFTGNSEAMLHLISVSASCLTCVEELSSGTHRQRLGRSPAPPPVGSQMTVFRLDCRANEVEQLHVPSNAHSSLPPTPPNR